MRRQPHDAIDETNPRAWSRLRPAPIGHLLTALALLGGCDHSALPGESPDVALPPTDMAYVGPDIAFSGTLGENPADVIASCVTRLACFPDSPYGFWSLQACLHTTESLADPYLSKLLGISLEEVRCLARAKNDCVAAGRCLNLGMAQSGCPGNMCEGNVAVSCFGSVGVGTQVTHRFDCGAVNLVCTTWFSESDGSHAVCSSGTCAGTWCTGDDFHFCPGPSLGSNYEIMQDCAFEGSTCGWYDGLKGCIGTGDACDADAGTATTTCEGPRTVSCQNNHLARQDCRKLLDGATCFPMRGCGLGNECDESMFHATCAGSKLTFCAFGKLTTTDCTAFGFPSCTSSGGARCTR